LRDAFEVMAQFRWAYPSQYSLWVMEGLSALFFSYISLLLVYGEEKLFLSLTLGMWQSFPKRHSREIFFSRAEE
jgi:hypothetical protein